MEVLDWIFDVSFAVSSLLGETLRHWKDIIVVNQDERSCILSP